MTYYLKDESVDYSPPNQPLQPTVQVQNQELQTPNSNNTSASNPDTVTDSSLDSSSIEVLQLDTGLQIQLPINPPQRQPPTTPPTPRTNVVVPHNDTTTMTILLQTTRRQETRRYHRQ